MDRGEGLLVAQVAQPVGLDATGSLAPSSIRIRRAVNRWGWRGFLAIVFLALFGPLAILVAFSFNDSNILAFPFDGLTTKWYSLALQDPSLREALLNSTAVAFIVAPLCLVLGTLAAFGLTRFRFRGRGAIGGLVGAPLVLPWLIVGIAALMGYAKANVDLSLKTVIATQTICTFPLVTAIVSAQLFRFQRVQEEAAIDLGCSRLEVLRHIILPHIAPGARRRRDLRVHVVVQQLRDQRVHDRVPADVPDLGVLVGAEPRSHRDRERDLDADLRRAGRADLPGAPDAPLARRRQRHHHDRDAAAGRRTAA